MQNFNIKGLAGPIAFRVGYLSIFVLIIFSAVLSVAADEEGPNPLKPALVSEVTAIRPGEPFYVGLWLDHPEHYHSYWKAPGIVGIPTDLKWLLPDGFAAGEIRWPVPERVSMAGINAHGYHGRTLLMVEITPPPKLPDGPITLQASVSWMCCWKTCHPGFEDVALSLPVDAKAKETRWDSEWHPVFESTRAKFPEPLSGWNVTASESSKQVIFKITPSGGGDLTANPSAASVYFFCGDGQINSEAPQLLKRDSDGTFTLTMTRSQFGPKDATTFPGLLFCEEGWLEGGTQQYGSVEVPRR